MADLYVLEGRALAALNEQRAASHAVAKAEEAFQHVVPENEPEWARFIDIPYVFGEAAYCFRDLGQVVQVERFASESATAASQQGRARRGALSHAALAISALDRRDVETAATMSLQVVDLTGAVNSSRCIEAVRDLQHRLRQHSQVPEVERFNERARELLGLAA
jgi:hypothetical protein